VEPRFHFAFYGLDWIRPWPGVGMELHWLALGVLATGIMLGIWYRISATLFFIGFSYVFLLDQARYLNHFYLVGLISFLMIFVPAHRYFSLDALLKPQLSTRLVPAWSVWLLRFQVGVPYFFGGIAKLNADWLRGEPLRTWLAHRTDFPLIGQFFTNDAVVWPMTYGSLFLDLFAVFLLTNRRTRVFGYLAIIAFHFMNSRFFQHRDLPLDDDRRHRYLFRAGLAPPCPVGPQTWPYVSHPCTSRRVRSRLLHRRVPP